MLNCKVGQIAIIMYSYGDNLGKIVQCLQLLPAGTDGVPGNGPRWLIERTLVDNMGDSIQSVADRHLRPLLGGLADVIEKPFYSMQRHPLPIRSEHPKSQPQQEPENEQRNRK